MARLYGFTDQSRNQLHEAETEAIRQTVSRIFGGMNRNQAIAWMAEAGYRTTQGGLWANWPLTRLLTNPAIAGLRKDPETGELVPTGGPAPLTPEEFHRLQPILARASGARTGAAHDRDYWASQVLTCGLSEDPMIGSPNPSGTPAYRCGTCRRVQIVAEPVEDFLSDIIVGELSRPERMQQLRQALEQVKALVTNLRAEETALVGQRTELADALAAQEIAVADFKEGTRANTERLEEVRSRLRYLEQVANLDLGDGTDLASWWKNASPATRAGAARLTFKKVVVHPATGRNPHPDEDEIRDRLDVHLN
ncbi:recombinase family protein [Streptacidiphilus cavernicola]|uniref:Recombinase family protein n=1 Tax=Streptacidiphilus cavernicola TaxID=3342716 RepID=A0ABV6W255_9ACTN